MTIYTLEPSTEIIWRSPGVNGEPVAREQPCDCRDRIPGLEADLCKVHRIYWRDTWLEKRIRDRKSQGSAFDATVLDEKSDHRRTTSKSKDIDSAEIWGQEGGLEGDRLVRDTAIASKAKNQPLKTIVAGSRSIKSLEVVEQAIAASGFQISEVVSGTASGVDKLGEEWAVKNAIAIKQFPADWDTHGKRAGYLRNAEMAQYAEAAIVVWDGESKGTAHMISEVKKHGLKLFVHRTDEQQAEETGELIRVVNVHKLTGKLPNLIVAMKSKGHPLGNPFYREAKSDRAGCIRKFKKWLWEQYQIEGSAVRAEIEAIADLVMAGEQVNLGCVCKQPNKFVACHCDEIKALVEWVIAQRLEVAA